MYWDRDLSIWQNIVMNYQVRRAIKEINRVGPENYGVEWREFFKQLNGKKK